MKKDFTLYKERKFGEKVSITFDFLTKHWRLWLQCFVYLVLPLCLLQAVALNGFFGGMLNNAFDAIGYNGLFSTGASYIGFIVFTCIGMLLLSSLTYAMIRHYHENGDSLEGVAFKDLVPRIKKNFIRGLLVGLLEFTAFVLFLVLLLINGSAFLGFVACVGIMVILLPLLLAMPVCMFEDGQNAFSTLKRAFVLGWPVWGGTFLLVLVIGFIGNILQGLASMPYYIIVFVKTILTSEEKGVGVIDTPWFSFIVYILAVIETLGTYIAMSFTVIALGYQYGNSAEQMDAVSVDEGIDNFEKLADNDELDNFENL